MKKDGTIGCKLTYQIKKTVSFGEIIVLLLLLLLDQLTLKTVTIIFMSTHGNQQTIIIFILF